MRIPTPLRRSDVHDECWRLALMAVKGALQLILSSIYLVSLVAFFVLGLCVAFLGEIVNIVEEWHPIPPDAPDIFKFGAPKGRYEFRIHEGNVDLRN